MRLAVSIAAAMLSVAPAIAALAPGAKAPLFKAKGAAAGKPYDVDLGAALKKGPVVLYFFPAAFTPGCNAEAHGFAEAAGDFAAAGATVIGMTAGNVDQLAKFSSEKCAGKFPVAAAAPDVVKAYDVVLKGATGYTSRTSYVITPDGKVFYAHDDLNPADHIRNTLDAVRRYRAAYR